MTVNYKRAEFIGVFILSLLFVFPAAAGAADPSQSSVATETAISLVDGLTVDEKGNIYITRRDHNTIDKIDLKGRISRFAGSGEAGFAGDGGLATKAKLKIPANLTFDAKGNLYIADRDNHRVRKVDTRGIITTVAGNGTAGFSGDGGPAVKASLNLPSGVVADSKGNLYIADRSNDRVRVVDSKGIIRTFAGSGDDGYSGDMGPAKKARLSKPFGLAMDKKGNLYIADRGNNRIRKVGPRGTITTVAGDGSFFFMGDNGPAYRASIAGPTGVAVDNAGNVYIADRNNNRIRFVDKQGMIRTVVGTGQQDYNGDSEVARETNLHLPFGVALQPDGRLLIIDRSHYRIRRVDMRTGKVDTVAGNGEKQALGDGGPATGASLSFPHGIVVDEHDNVIFSDKSNSRIRKITPEGIISTIVGNGTRGTLGDGGPALEAAIFGPTTLVRSKKGELYFVSQSGYANIIRRVDTNGIIDHFLDTSEEQYHEAIKASSIGKAAGDARAMITQFSDLTFDADGNLYIADRLNNQIRKLDTQGKITTIAGIGDSDYDGDGGPAIKASFRDPQALVVDKDGNIFIADAANNRVRKVDTRGIVTTIAGDGQHLDRGDGGPALQASIRNMNDLAFSPAGELYIVGANSHVIRKIKKDGTIETVAGKAGIQGNSGDGGPATQATLKQPAAIAFDSKGNMYISDMGNNSIRKVDTQGIITSIAGMKGGYGWGHDGETVEIYFHNFP